MAGLPSTVLCVLPRLLLLDLLLYYARLCFGITSPTQFP